MDIIRILLYYLLPYSTTVKFFNQKYNCLNICIRYVLIFELLDIHIFVDTFNAVKFAPKYFLMIFVLLVKYSTKIKPVSIFGLE